jgi:phosphatidylglycerophosphate synthase
MPRPTVPIAIDARHQGPGGPLAAEVVLGRPVLAHLVDLAAMLDAGPVVVHARLDDQRRLRALANEWHDSRVVFTPGTPEEGATILRSDRFYDPARLRRAVRAGHDPETVAIWRLDRPGGVENAEAELIRRRTYQPLGRYWALAPAQWLARRLCPTGVHPNVLTLTAAALVIGASAAVALAPPAGLMRGLTATALALALVLDTADGHLARLQGTASEFGRWLDALLDELGDMTLHGAIAWSAFAREHAAGWLVLGMIYAMGKYVFMVGNERWQSTEATRQGGALAQAEPVSLTSWIRLAGHADVRWHLWIVLAVLGRLDAALVAYAIYYPTRALAGALRKAAAHG